MTRRFAFTAWPEATARRAGIAVLYFFCGLFGLFGGVWAVRELYWLWKYPYGASHCCDKALIGYLLHYAEDSNGNFPSGEASPEASLSLLHRNGHPAEKGDLINILRGKTVPERAVRERLESGQLLDPATCGWHYVEGLRSDDDPRLALFWDKVGLGHSGQRLSTGGHYVWFVNATKEYIPEVKWEVFLREQEELHRHLEEMRAAAQRKGADNKPAELPPPDDEK